MSQRSIPPLTRRQFLASAAAIPAIASLTVKPAFAAAPRQTAPYLELEKYLAPGRDEFPGEREAAQIVAQLNASVRAGELPIADSCRGSSPQAATYEALAPDLEQARFDSSDRAIAEGWKRWVKGLGSIRRAQFFPLPESVVRFEVASESEGQLRYRVGQWKQIWQGGKLVEFAPIDEHVTVAAKPWFRDITEAAFHGEPAFPDQLAHGIPYWRARLDPATGIDLYGSNGIAVGDIDGDGIDEVYVCQPGGLPNRLFRFQANGQLQDITERWGAGILDDTSSALFLDLRNTGRQDLVVLRSSGPLLFLNEGGRFTLAQNAFRFETLPAGGFTGMAAADFDRDGKLDLYLCCYVYFQSEAQYTYASPYHDARNGPPNFLFRNRLNADGSGAFFDCTGETGMNENNDRFSFAPAWCDFNGDGWPDLYVANDFGRKNLYVNHNGRFRDQAASAGVDDIGPGMSASWFDYDGDGKPDLYVANMWTAAGQRVIADQNFAPARELKGEEFRGHTMGNSLFRNRGDGGFADVTAAEHAGFGRWAWSSGGHDLDNDGHPELFGTCGMLTNTSTEDLSSFFWRQVVARSPVKFEPSAAYEAGWNALNQFIREEYSWNGREPNVVHARRGGRYFDFSGVSGLDFADDSRAYAVTDFDGDGRPDVILKSRLGPQVRVLQNDCATGRNAIALQLRGTRSNRDAIGARVEVDGQTKWLEAGSGFLSQHSKRMTFGLGGAAQVKRVQVTWPSGAVQEFGNLAAGNCYVLTEDSPQVTSTAFRAHAPLTATALRGDNELRLQDTWLLDPVPLPEAAAGVRLLVLMDGQKGAAGYTLPSKTIDFTKEPAERRTQYEIFRRYLFDWRTKLTTPLAFLLNDAGHAVKVYAQLPSNAQVQEDAARMADAGRLGLPFAGFYIKPPRRDFFKFGAAFLWAGYPEQALPYLEQTLRQTPDNARVLVLTGQIHLQGGRIDRAEARFREALAASPGYAEAFSGLGDVCDARNDFQQAMVNYEKALALKPDLMYTLLNAGHAADKLDQQARAAVWFREALRLNAHSPEAANGLGLALAKQGQTAEARPLFEQAIAERPDYADAVNNLGVLYMQQSKTNDAIAAFTYGIKVAPDEDILYLNLGRTYIGLGKLDKAREVMRQLLERKPDSTTAKHALQELDSR